MTGVIYSRGSLFGIVSLAILAWPGPAVCADETAGNGERIYRQTCARCHGQSGQGVEDQFTEPLAGDKSVTELAGYIDQWMPEDAPEQCTGEDAKQVARYIYDAFYSPAAQGRNRPARIELSRLTVRQYRNSVADLVESFREPRRRSDQRGLPARYYNKERPRGRPALRRIDSQVRFHYGPSNLPPEKLDRIKGFSARWEGSVVAPETGKYELVVRTNHAARLWLNDLDEALIDAWVQSGDETRHTASIYLLGGRAYPLRLEFSSRQQGVDDKKKYDGRPREAFLELRWKPPRGVEEIIPARQLLQEPVPELYVVETPFPPDDRSHGYVRGTSISEAWDKATADAGIQTARYVTDHLAELAGSRSDEGDSERLYRAFCRQWVGRAFRRPPSEELKTLYIDRQFAEAPDLETAVKRVVMLTLKSPRFLYVDIGGEKPDAYNVASRLSLSLWDSLPDETLLKEAAAGRLASRDEIARQAERMVDDPRTRSKLRQFLHQWLQLEHHGDLAKDDDKYPKFDEQLAADLRTSLDLFLDDVIWGVERHSVSSSGDSENRTTSPGERSGDFRELLKANTLYLNGRLAEYYGYDLPADAPFQKVDAKQPQRVGVLSHPYMMAAFAYTDYSSPIHRGVFLIRSVLGRTLRPPQKAFTPLAPDLHPEMTTRERVAMQTKSKSCQACHGVINPMGFTLEHFDAVGRFRETEKGKPIDATGRLKLPSGETKRLDGARELAEFLAENRETHRSFMLQLFNHMVKQPVRAYGQDTSDELQKSFAETGYDVPKMMAEIATKAAMAGLEPAVDRETAQVSPSRPKAVARNRR